MKTDRRKKAQKAQGPVLRGRVIEFHCDNFEELPKRTQKAVFEMVKLAAKAISEGKL